MTTTGYIVITVLFILTIIARTLSNNEDDLKMGYDMIMIFLFAIVCISL